MGLLKAGIGSLGGVLADQWKEFFYCDALPADTIAVKGKRRISGRSSNTKGGDNVISNGSVIAVADGQCMLIVDQGKVAEVCAEPGEFIYDSSTEPSLFTGPLGTSIKETFKNIGKRFTFGGEPPKDQRVYYLNTKELMGNKYGTPTPIPFRVVDARANLDMDLGLRCFGEYSYKVVDPLLFYTNICGNVTEDFRRQNLESQLRSELLSALQPALARLSEKGVRYSAVVGHTTELADYLKEELSKKWRDYRGIEIQQLAMSSVSLDEEDEKMIKELQRNATLSDEKLARAHMVGARAAAIQAAADNPNGAAMAMMGMNMTDQVGGNYMHNMQMEQMQAQLAQMQAQNAQLQAAMATPAPAPAAAAPAGWTCSCGQEGNRGKFCMNCGSPQPQPKPQGGWQCACGARNTGKFCMECGSPKPADEGWTCACGAVNKGKFCQECGARKPAGVPQYKCDKCGWEPADPSKAPKFCPECGDVFDAGDLV